MKTTKKTLRQRVQDILKQNPDGLCARDMAATLKVPSSRVSNMLWLMRKDGQVRHDAKLHLYYPMGVKPEPEPEPEPEPVQAQPKETNAHTVPWAQYHNMRHERDELQGKCDDLCDVIEGMDAVIRYLENRIDNLIRAQVI